MFDSNSVAAVPVLSSPLRKFAPAAGRALAEVLARRADIDRRTAERLKETSGRDRPGPARYGGWENKGIASDF
jgi:hypothetical protein